MCTSHFSRTVMNSPDGHGLECFGMFYMDGGREIVERYGKLWNVTEACGMSREIVEC